MIDFTEIPYDSDLWELFARDFLEELGFRVESPPDRGADQGKDMLVSETISGTLYHGTFRWLVSCKHFAHSGRSVNERADEQNILERLGAFGADGFMGFYSTLPSSGLNSRLRQLRDEGKIREYRIFDHKLIENHLLTVGFSRLMIRYLPECYRAVKPLNFVTDKYEPLLCEACDKDLLQEMFTREYSANMVIAYSRGPGNDRLTEDVYVVCKGGCDQEIENVARLKGYYTGWTDISDLVIPQEYLRNLFAVMNRIRDGADQYTDEAWQKQRKIFITLGQKVFRAATEKEKERFRQLVEFPFL